MKSGRNLFHMTSEIGSEVAERGVETGSQIKEFKYDPVRYHDVGNMEFLNSSGIAYLINIAKVWLNQGVEVRFLNVPADMKHTIKELELDDVVRCE